MFDETADPINIENNNYEDEFLNAEMTIDEVLRSISKLPVGKSPGNDGVSSEFYKCTSDILGPLLCNLFNSILSTGNFFKNY